MQIVLPRTEGCVVVRISWSVRVVLQRESPVAVLAFALDKNFGKINSAYKHSFDSVATFGIRKQEVLVRETKPSS